MRVDIGEYDVNERTSSVGRPGRFWAGVTVLLVLFVAIPVAVGRTVEAGPAAAPACTGTVYTVVAGDSWSKIASKVGVGMNALLAANGATTSTAIFPGGKLCVPAGATGTTTTSPSVTTTVTPTVTPTAAPKAGGVSIKQFPVQGLCWFTDTFGAPRSGGRSHEGVDIIAKAGLLLYAADDGTLTKQYINTAGSLTGNGWRLTRADGTYFHYAHLSAFAAGLKAGSAVKAGQIIGYVGMTGNAGTPHLHFEIHPGGGSAVNPTAAVKAVDGCKTTVIPPQPGAIPATTAPTTAAPTAPVTTAKPAVTTTTVKPVVTTTTSKPVVTTTTVGTPPGTAGPATKWQFVAPVKALDTAGSKLVPGKAKSVAVNALAGVPATSPGVMVRMSARNIAAPGNVTVHACNAGPNGATSLTVAPGRLNATMTVAKVVSGTICVTTSVALDLRVDVVGFLAADGAGVQPIAAKRALDTRTSQPIPAGGTRAALPKALGTPLGAKAVTVSLTLLNPAAAGSIGVGACGGTPWIVPFTTAASQMLSAIVRTNDAGICVSSTADVHVILDVTGVWSSSAAVLPTGPQRLFDSRSAAAITVTGMMVSMPLPAGTTRAQLTVTAIAGAQSGALFVWSCTDPKPAASVVSVSANSNASATVSMSTIGGTLCLSSNSSLHAVVDIVALG